MANTFTVDLSQLRNAQEALRLAPKRLQAAAVRAVNRVILTGRKVVSEDVRVIYNAKAGDLKARMAITRATRMSNGVVEAKLTMGNRRLPLKQFGSNQTGAGVTARIRKADGRRLYRSAFDPAAQGKRLSNRQIFTRVPNNNGGGRVDRLPITPITGPSLVVMYDDNLVETRVDSHLDEALIRRLDAEIDFELTKV